MTPETSKEVAVSAPDDDPRPDEAVAGEALRLNDRFVREVIEGFDVCPFARGARVSGRALREVIHLRTRDTAPLVEALARWEAGDPRVEIVQLLLPRLALGPVDFEAFVAEVRAARAALPSPQVFALAPFHPGFVCDARTPHTLVHFFRRSPQPMIQLVRLTTLDGLDDAEPLHGATPEALARLLRGEVPPPSMSARITQRNWDVATRGALAKIAAVYASILAERDGGG